MSRRMDRVLLGVEAMESRALLSGATPVLTMSTYNTVVAQVGNVMGTLAKTHNFSAAGTMLTNVSAERPYGRQQLAPTWVGDLGIYNTRVPGSGLVMQGQILNDLYRYVVAGVAAGRFQVVGPGSAAINHAAQESAPGSTAVSAASVNIVNNTGYAITVTAFLNGTTRQITHPIAIGGKALFDFQSSSMNFISINISRTDGGQPPLPLHGASLGRPISGYYGTSFPISVFAGVYSVGQG